MYASSILLALALAVLTTTATAKLYTRCELAKELKNRHGFTRNELPDWLCLVKHESSYNTSALNVNNPPSRGVDYGLFQINDNFWCAATPPRGTNDCNIRCSVLLDNNIADDIKCARKIKARHGFNAWFGWKNNCRGKNLSSYLRDCNV